MKVTKVTVTFNAKIPTQSYGNIETGGVWEAELEAGDTPEAVTQDLFGRIRDQITAAVMPIAQAKMRQVEPLINALPTEHRMALMEKFGVIQYLMTVAPAIDFANVPKTTASVTGAGITNGNTPPWETEKT